MLELDHFERQPKPFPEGHSLYALYPPYSFDSDTILIHAASCPVFSYQRSASGIVRTEAEMQTALEQLQKLWERASRVGVIGNRDFNPGWHTALDLKNLLTISEAITLAALERKESRGAQFREDFPDKDDRFAKVNTIVAKGDDGSMQVRLEPLPEMPDYLKRVVEENR